MLTVTRPASAHTNSPSHPTNMSCLKNQSRSCCQWSGLKNNPGGVSTICVKWNDGRPSETTTWNTCWVRRFRLSCCLHLTLWLTLTYGRMYPFLSSLLNYYCPITDTKPCCVPEAVHAVEYLTLFPWSESDIRLSINVEFSLVYEKGSYLNMTGIDLVFNTRW